MKPIFLVFFLMATMTASAQELYVFTEPASNMPARSVGFRLTGNFTGKGDAVPGRTGQRYIPEVMFGFSNKLMMHVGGSFSNLGVDKLQWESVFLYGKYRFFSIDEVHQHSRMALFLQGAYSRNPFMMDEISLHGENSGVQLGIIATQLWNRLAVSATIGHTQVLHGSRFNKENNIRERGYQAMNYSLSAGYLLFPREYTDYGQVNVNLYTELLAQQTLDRQAVYIDFAPAIQFIFNSNLKLNLGARFEVLNKSMLREGAQSWLISFEGTVFNALKKKKK